MRVKCVGYVGRITVKDRFEEFNFVVIGKTTCRKLKAAVIGEELTVWNFLLEIEYRGNVGYSDPCTWHGRS